LSDDQVGASVPGYCSDAVPDLGADGMSTLSVAIMLCGLHNPLLLVC